MGPEGLSNKSAIQFAFEPTTPSLEGLHNECFGALSRLGYGPINKPKQYLTFKYF